MTHHHIAGFTKHLLQIMNLLSLAFFQPRTGHVHVQCVCMCFGFHSLCNEKISFPIDTIYYFIAKADAESLKDYLPLILVQSNNFKSCLPCIQWSWHVCRFAVPLSVGISHKECFFHLQKRTKSYCQKSCIKYTYTHSFHFTGILYVFLLCEHG